MKVHIVIILSMITSLSLIFTSPAVCQQAGNENLISVYSAAIDEVIAHCKNKIALRDSKSEHLRQTAALACMKAAFFKDFKDELIKDMIKEEIGTKPYKIQDYLNTRFFDIIHLKYAKLKKRFES